MTPEVVANIPPAAVAGFIPGCMQNIASSACTGFNAVLNPHLKPQLSLMAQTQMRELTPDAFAAATSYCKAKFPDPAGAGVTGKQMAKSTACVVSCPFPYPPGECEGLSEGFVGEIPKNSFAEISTGCLESLYSSSYSQITADQLSVRVLVATSPSFFHPECPGPCRSAN